MVWLTFFARKAAEYGGMYAKKVRFHAGLRGVWRARGEAF